MIFGERPEVGLPDSRFAKPIQSEVAKRATDALPQNSGIRYRVCRTPWPTETTATPSSSSNAMYVSPPGSVSAEIQSARIAVRATVEDAELCFGIARARTFEESTAVEENSTISLACARELLKTFRGLLGDNPLWRSLVWGQEERLRAFDDGLARGNSRSDPHPRRGRRCDCHPTVARDAAADERADPGGAADEQVTLRSENVSSRESRAHSERPDSTGHAP
jgi:hypothetical protein